MYSQKKKADGRDPIFKPSESKAAGLKLSMHFMASSPSSEE
jgi:hypothetical protein